ncbi:sensor histidine kinase [Prosthecomicrobium sp. N25]|uniref:sensor histidine kinase n=1 Tax=Prosthecomicrobium sp. N25 TaxID=3129254 RepID=UPI0030789A7D
MSLTARLFLFGLLAILPTIGVILYLELELRRAREAEVFDAVLRQTQQATSEMAQFVEGTRMLLTAVASAPSVRRLDEEACGAYLETLTRDAQNFRSIRILGLDGRMRCRPGVDTAAMPSFADRPYFMEAVREGRFAVGTYTRGKGDTSIQALPFALPVRSEEGAIIGVAVAVVDTDRLGRIVAGWAVPAGGNLTLADRDGVILARNPLHERFVGTRIPDEFQKWVRGAAVGVDRALSQDGTARIIAYKPASLYPAGLYISSGVAEAQAFGPIDLARRSGLMIILGAAVLAVAGAWWAGRAFVRSPVGRLIEIAAGWGEGRRPDLPPPDGREFRLIGEALDRMGSGLEEREAAARQSEERLRRTIRAAPHPFMLHAEDGEILELSDAWTELSGYPRAELARSEDFWRAALPDSPQDGRDPVLRPFETEAHLSGLERTIITGDGRRRVWEFAIVPLEPLADGRKLRLTTAVDVTERYRAIEQQRLLLRELDHRVKNTLATAQSIASQTYRATPDPQEFVRRFSERLGALARTHDMLTKGNWRGASLKDQVETELAHVPNPERIRVEGPDLTLPPETAVPVGLVIHELTTNAIKYGALSAPEGRLSVVWTASNRPGGAVDLVWRETGGPPAGEPVVSGFGSRLVRQLGKALGSATSIWHPEGLEFHLRIDLPQREAEAPFQPVSSANWPGREPEAAAAAPPAAQ